MSRSALRLARIYAQAYVNTFGDTLSLEDITAMGRTYTFLAAHRKAQALLKFPDTKIAEKRDFLVTLCEQFDLAGLLPQLIDLLLEHKRSFLITQVLYYICLLYAQRYDVASFTITSSHDLEATALQRIEHFLATKTGGRVVCAHTVDADLIAGVRAQSRTLLWEYSVRKQLKGITNYLSAEG